MKKALAIALVLILVLALCACGGRQEASVPLIGSWSLSGLELGGQDYTSLLSHFDIHLIFEPDGTGTMISAGEEFSLTWGGSSFSDGTDTYSYTLEGDTLSFEAEGMTFFFTRG